VHVSLTLRVTEEFLERLDQWRAQQISPLSRNATVVALIEGGIQREGVAIDLTAGADLPGLADDAGNSRPARLAEAT
jgi:hypothetical protein